MIVKINEHYKVKIDKVKEVVVKEDYTLKSPYFFIFLYSLTIFYNVTLLSSKMHFMIIILYTLPILCGTIYEFFKLKQYKKSFIGQDTIKRILEILSLRIINIMFFMLAVFLIWVHSISSKMFYYFIYADQINILLISIYFISIIMSLILFFMGMLIEKKEVTKKKKKGFIASLIIGGLAILGYFFLRESGFSLVILVLIGFFILPYATGKTYFRYKNFDKKVTENDTMIDYVL